MPNLKILFAGRLQAVGPLVREMAAQADMEIVGVHLDPIEVLLTARRRNADVVVIPLNDSEEPGLVSHLFAEFPDVTVLMLSPTGDAAYVVQRCPWRRALFNTSADHIVKVLRGIAKAPCGPLDALNEQAPR
jgi:DNA-binding NarL/FixJ family response regulator